MEGQKTLPNRMQQSVAGLILRIPCCGSSKGVDAALELHAREAHGRSEILQVAAQGLFAIQRQVLL